MDFLLAASSLLVFSTAVGFGLWFGLTEPWRRHPFGQSVMMLTVGVAILSGLGLLRTILGDDYAAREALIVVGRALVAGGLLQRAYVLAREKRRDRLAP